MISTIEEFKWVVVGSVANEIAFWSAHFADNAERFARSMDDVTDWCYNKMREVKDEARN